MVVLRATQKILRSLPQSEGELGASHNARGDWYVNRMVIDRRPLLLIVSSKSLLAIVTPARDVRTLPAVWLKSSGSASSVSQLAGPSWPLRSKPPDTSASEKTIDRSVTGQLVDFAKALPYYLPIDGWDEATLRAAEEKLAETPCRSSRRFAEVIRPSRTAVQLLTAAWPASRVRH